MRDQEKSDFLKAKILAEKGMSNQSDMDKPTNTKKEMDALEKAKTIDASVSLLSWILGVVSTYYTQLALFTKFSTIAPFGFWEVTAMYLFFTTTVKYLSKSIKSITSARTKI